MRKLRYILRRSDGTELGYNADGDIAWCKGSGTSTYAFPSRRSADAGRLMMDHRAQIIEQELVEEEHE